MVFTPSPELASAQAQAQAQRTQVDQARQQVEEAQRKAEEQRRKLQQARESLPERQSRRALTQKYAGLQGRKVRQQIKGAEEEIEGKVGEVTTYEETIVKPAKQQVEQADTELKAYEAQVNEASANEQGYYLAQKFYAKKVPLQFVDDPYVRKYLKEMYAQASSQAEYQQKLIDNPALLQQKVDALVQKGFSEEKAFAKLGFKLDTSQLDRTTKVQVDTKLADIKTLELSASMGIKPSTTFRNVLTGDMISAREAPKGYVPVNVEFEKLSSPMSSNINIKTPDSIKLDGTSLVSGRAISLPSGDAMGDISSTQSGGFLRFISNRFDSGFKKVTEAPQIIIGGEASRIVSAQEFGTVSTIPRTKVISEYEYQTRVLGNVPIIGGEKDFVAPPNIKSQLEQLRYTASINPTKPLAQVGGVASGFGISLLGNIEFAKTVFTQSPIKTGKAIVGAGKEVGRRVISGEGFPELGRVIRQEPSYAVGYLASEYLLGRGAGVVTKKVVGVVKQRPIIEKIKIEAPIRQVKSSEVIGKDIYFNVGDESKNIVRFAKQKLSQVGIEGQRVVIKSQSKLGEWLGREPKLIYEGLPTDKLGRKKALKLLERTGYSEQGAKQILRYSAPRIIEQGITKGRINIIGEKAVGKVEAFISQPIKVIDKKLGIKTRGGAEQKEVIDFFRKGFEFNEKEYAIELARRNKFIYGREMITAEGGDITFGVSRTVSKETTFPVPKAKIGDVILFEEKPSSIIYSKSVQAKIFPREKGTTSDLGKTTLIREEVNLPNANNILDFNGREVKTKVKSIDLLKQLPKTESKIVKKTKNNLELPKLEEKPFQGTTNILSTESKLSKTFPATSELNIQVDTVKPEVMQLPLEKSMIQVGVDAKTIIKTQVKQNNLIKDLARDIQKPQVREQLKLQVQQLQLQQTKQQSKQTQRSVLKTTKSVKAVKPLKPIKILKLPKTSPKAQMKTSKLEDVGEFKVFVRKAGKDVKLGTFGSKEKATQELIGKLKGTIAASGFLESKGKRVKVSELGNLGEEFGVGKREAYRLVQRKERRFGTKSETTEAQFFRKAAKGGFF